MIGTIYRHGRPFTQNEYISEFAGAGEFDDEVISFLQQWESGTTDFSIKTSGSTGPPKTIVVSRQQMEASATFTGDYFRLQPGMRMLLAINPALIAGKMILVRAMCLDLDVVIVNPMANPLEAVGNLHVDLAPLVPYQMAKMLDSGQPLDQVDQVLLGGAPVSLELQHRIQQLETPVFQSFGMTETVSHVAVRRLNATEDTDKYAAIGDASFSTTDEGCLVIRGSVTGNKEVVTNDHVDLIDAQSFRWLGRKDLVINSGGVKLHPEQIEGKIADQLFSAGISVAFFIFSESHPELGEQLAILLESDPFELQGHFDKLEKYERPKKVYFHKFCYTASGKVDRVSTIASLEL